MKMVLQYLLFICIVLGAHGDGIPDVAWVRASNGTLPTGTLIAGHDQDTAQDLYVCRAKDTTGVGSSGLFMPKLRGCIFALKKTCHINSTYEVLTVQPRIKLHWAPDYAGGEVPLNAVADGYGHYVGRSEYLGGMYPGAISPKAEVNLFCARNRYQWKSPYDVLTYKTSSIFTSYNITNVTYNLNGLKVANQSDPMIVASDVVRSNILRNAEARITLPYEQIIVRRWNVTNYEMDSGVPVLVYAGVLGTAVTGDFGITAKRDHFLETPDFKEIKCTSMIKDVTVTLGSQGTTVLTASKTMISAQERLVTIPFKATLQWFTDQGSGFDPIDGEYTDLQNYDVETHIVYP